jgi:hypothetical protein
MIIWSGFGIIVPMIACAFVGASMAAAGSTSDGKIPILFGLILSGIACYFLDRIIEKRFTRTVIDKETGHEFKIGMTSSFFFIPMRFFIVIFPVIGIVQLFR